MGQGRDHAMKIILRQTGGFTGFLQHQLDTQGLAPGQAGDLQALIRSGLEELETPPPARIGNRPAYELEIDDGQALKTYTIDPARAGEHLKELFRFIRTNGKPCT